MQYGNFKASFPVFRTCDEDRQIRIFPDMYLFSKHARLRKRDIDSDHLPSVNLIFDFVKVKPCRDRAENDFLSHATVQRLRYLRERPARRHRRRIPPVVMNNALPGLKRGEGCTPPVYPIPVSDRAPAASSPFPVQCIQGIPQGPSLPIPGSLHHGQYRLRRRHRSGHRCCP